MYDNTMLQQNALEKSPSKGFVKYKGFVSQSILAHAG